jgi:hypothetical protein
MSREAKDRLRRGQGACIQAFVTGSNARAARREFGDGEGVDVAGLGVPQAHLVAESRPSVERNQSIGIRRRAE